MARYILVGYSDAHPGKEDEFNRWYSEEHLPDICKVPGVVSGRRFALDASSPQQAPTPYLAIYELETDDPAAVMAEIGRRGAAGEYSISPAMNFAAGSLTIFKQN